MYPRSTADFRREGAMIHGCRSDAWGILARRRGCKLEARQTTSKWQRRRHGPSSLLGSVILGHGSHAAWQGSLPGPPILLGRLKSRALHRSGLGAALVGKLVGRHAFRSLRLILKVSLPRPCRRRPHRRLLQFFLLPKDADVTPCLDGLHRSFPPLHLRLILQHLFEFRLSKAAHVPLIVLSLARQILSHDIQDKLLHDGLRQHIAASHSV
mmetsp:Transcript_5715/g.22421  ORF Transcript_5715/g.22421 Transcript_5715/m.22421 type:complete len:211 (-) Transcript_5715:250-882(-)